ncbi:transposable element Tc1 transposase [Trichonephila clavipes]|uniref:Transposable element Tc1 transposase n=1 Tax=Trichonephila clavipes TaxID=2585209 RepID=A0A8X6SF28_TRICX|nr:transposable element Tc1 transposase [Trichonephila clavipes]
MLLDSASFMRLTHSLKSKGRLGSAVGLSLAFCTQGCGFDPGPSRWNFMLQKIDSVHVKYKKTGSVANIPGRGRKEILSTTAKRKIIHSVKKDLRVSASKLALSISFTIGEKISDKTIRRTLHQYGFQGRTPIRKPLINDGRFKIWREDGKALAPKNIIKTVKFGGGSALVWGCMSAVGVGELAFIDGFIVQQDNEPKHTATIVQLYLLYHCRKQLHTPPQSPDLNVIENVWSQLEKAVHEHEITSKEVLKKVPREEWAKFSVETTNTLVESMLRLQDAGRCAVLLARWIVRSCAVRNCWEQWTRKGTHVRKTGSGATMKTTRREDQRIVRQALVDPTVTRSPIRADVGVAIVP